MGECAYLVHHGIKGQKWGVRRYQNEDGSLTEEGKKRYGSGPNTYGPIEDTVMKKGTVLRSVTGKFFDGRNYAESGRPLYTYNKENEWDNKVYKGPFSKFLAMYKGASFIAEFEYEVAEDLKMPTKKERVDGFLEIYKDSKFTSDMVETLEGYQRAMRQNGVGSKEAQNVNVRNLRSQEDFEKAYEVFNHAMEYQHSRASTREYISRMSKRYDAMVDDNNQGIYNAANDPVVILNTRKLVAKNAGMPIKFLSWDEIESNTEEVRRQLKTVGQNVKL